MCGGRIEKIAYKVSTIDLAGLTVKSTANKTPDKQIRGRFGHWFQRHLVLAGRTGRRPIDSWMWKIHGDQIRIAWSRTNTEKRKAHGIQWRAKHVYVPYLVAKALADIIVYKVEGRLDPPLQHKIYYSTEPSPFVQNLALQIVVVLTAILKVQTCEPQQTLEERIFVT
tara:strand:+ start:2384 stop:2887 length:504 start_codon:yes stop_codon:yes gene_type:complete